MAGRHSDLTCACLTSDQAEHQDPGPLRLIYYKQPYMKLETKISHIFPITADRNTYTYPTDLL